MLEVLRKLRKEKGATMKEVAAAIDVSEATVSLYERGLRSPSYEVLLKLGEYFDVSVDYLLSGKTERAEKAQYIQIEQSDTGFPHGFYLFDLGFLGFKLRSIDCFLSDDGTTIEFPDGILTVTKDELQELDQSTDSYIRFKLQELREKNKGNFKPYEKHEGLPEIPAADGPETTPEGK